MSQLELLKRLVVGNHVKGTYRTKGTERVLITRMAKNGYVTRIKGKLVVTDYGRSRL